MLYYFGFALLFVVSCTGQAALTNPSDNHNHDTAPVQPVPEPIPVPVAPPAPVNNIINPSTTHDGVCTRRNGYYIIDGTCDSYAECREFRAVNRLCPEGLHFNPNAHWPEYPCGYPSDVPCRGRGVDQPAQPTLECPHQYGFFSAEGSSPANCGTYKMCVAGKAEIMKCPKGLAFNPLNGQCDYPELVTSCNADEFLGFKCPPAPLDQFGQPISVIQNYKHSTECYSFFSCELGRARLLSCDYGLAFDPVVGHCVEADLVQCYREDYPRWY